MVGGVKILPLPSRHPPRATRHGLRRAGDSAPRRRETIKCWRLGQDSAASAATCPIGIGRPRRKVTSTVIIALAWQSFSRAATACASEAGEDRDHDRADLGAGEKCDDCLGNHRQKETDPLALDDAQPLEGVSQAASLTVKLGIGQPADCPILALPGNRNSFVAQRTGRADRGNDRQGLSRRR